MIRHALACIALVTACGTGVLGFQAAAAQTPAAAALPQVVSSVVPVYPPIARSARVSGDVVLAITVGADGGPVDVRVTRSIPLLDVAAIQAARQWRFEQPPAGTTSVVPITFRFALTAFAPATVSPGRDPGVPQDFAFQYRYFCGAGEVEIDSSRPLIAELSHGYGAVTRALVIAPDEEARLYAALVAGGFFEVAPPFGPPSILGVVVSERGVEITVDSGPPALQSFTTSHAANPPRFSHVLRVRRNGSVHGLTWQEPAAADAAAQQYSSIGAAVREIVTRANGGATPEPWRNVCP